MFRGTAARVQHAGRWCDIDVPTTTETMTATTSLVTFNYTSATLLLFACVVTAATGVLLLMRCCSAEEIKYSPAAVRDVRMDGRQDACQTDCTIEQDTGVTILEQWQDTHVRRCASDD